MPIEESQKLQGKKKHKEKVEKLRLFEQEWNLEFKGIVFK